MHLRIVQIARLLVFSLLISLGRGTPAQAAGTYYVAPTGSDSNAGTLASPWRTIQKAANTLQAGDTVYIRGGTYQERVVINVSGTSGNYITFQNYASESVTVNGNKSLPSTRGSGLIEINSKSYIKIIGLQVTNSFSYGIKNNGQYITIQNCEVSYSNDGGIISESVANNITVDGCDVHHNNDIGLSAWHEAVTMSGVNTFEVKNSQVHDNKEEGIVAKYDATNGSIHHNKSFNNNGPNIYLDGPSNIKVYNNEVHATLGAKAGIGLSIEDIDANGQTSNISIYNNLIYDNAAGIWFWIQTADSTKLFSGITIVNNVIYNNNRNTWGGVYLMSGGSSNYSNVVIRNNIFWENTLSGGKSIKGDTSVLSTFAIDHNLFKTGESSDAFGTSSVTTSDVQWVNKANNDFHLQSGSPAIDSGSTTGAPTVDYDGTARPQKNGFDLGAYEYASSTVTVPVAPSQLTVAAQ